MSELETASIFDGLRQLEEELSNARPHPKTPRKLTLDDLEVIPSVFQPRVVGDRLASYRHIESLMNSIMNETGNTLDPVTVWWSGHRWLVIDGHHRLDAHIELRTKGKGPKSIPVAVFKGTLHQAHDEAIMRNSKDKLSMRRDDKYTKAWQVVMMHPERSCRQIASLCKVGKTTVALMAKKYREYIAEYGDEWKQHIGHLTWKQACLNSKSSGEWGEDHEDREAEEIALYIRKKYGDRLTLQPKLLVAALAKLSPRIPYGIAEELPHYLDEEFLEMLKKEREEEDKEAEF